MPVGDTDTVSIGPCDCCGACPSICHCEGCDCPATACVTLNNFTAYGENQGTVRLTVSLIFSSLTTCTYFGNFTVDDVAVPCTLSGGTAQCSVPMGVTLSCTTFPSPVADLEVDCVADGVFNCVPEVDCDAAAQTCEGNSANASNADPCADSVIDFGTSSPVGIFSFSSATAVRGTCAA